MQATSKRRNAFILIFILKCFNKQLIMLSDLPILLNLTGRRVCMSDGLVVVTVMI